MIDQTRIRAAVRELLAAIGEDPDREGLAETPRRVAESYLEFAGGIALEPLDSLAASMPAGGASGDPVIVRGLAFRSMCEHHLLPFTGVAHVAYVPGDQLAGLGSLARLVDVLSARLQLQERLGDEIVDAVMTGLDARGALVVLDAEHQCVRARGPRQTGSSTVTMTARGCLGEASARAEIVALLGVPAQSSASAEAHRV